MEKQQAHLSCAKLLSTFINSKIKCLPKYCPKAIFSMVYCQEMSDWHTRSIYLYIRHVDVSRMKEVPSGKVSLSNVMCSSLVLWHPLPSFRPSFGCPLLCSPPSLFTALPTLSACTPLPPLALLVSGSYLCSALTPECELGRGELLCVWFLARNERKPHPKRVMASVHPACWSTEIPEGIFNGAHPRALCKIGHHWCFQFFLDKSSTLPHAFHHFRCWAHL